MTAASAAGATGPGQRAVLVTGAGSGIGASIAEAFAKYGDHVLIQDLREDAAREVAERLTSDGGSASAIGGDVSDPDHARAAIDHIIALHGRIDVLVNNAGLQYVAPLESYPLDRWNQLLAVLLTGPFLFTQSALPAMRDQGWGRIINISSINGKRGEKGKAAYCSAKHGIIGLTRVTALEAAEDGVTANAICPGFVDTPLVRNQLAGLAEVNGVTAAEVLAKVVLPAVPQRRLLDVSEVAALAIYLASDEARGVTGQAITVSGGLLMH